MKFHFKRTSLTGSTYDIRRVRVLFFPRLAQLLCSTAAQACFSLIFKINNNKINGKSNEIENTSKWNQKGLFGSQSRKSLLTHLQFGNIFLKTKTTRRLSAVAIARGRLKTFLQPQLKSEVLKCIKQEMAVFENLGERPKTLEMLFKALMTIPASSVESERAFSAAGLFVSKLRTSLSDNSVDMLCFMRSHLLKK